MLSACAVREPYFASEFGGNRERGAGVAATWQGSGEAVANGGSIPKENSRTRVRQGN